MTSDLRSPRTTKPGLTMWVPFSFCARDIDDTHNEAS